ncbi:hypothetical protein ABT034_06840 [Streptomyces sp. NPDC002773]|uniref:hypothetical protein n=1 Tax=Streptomyces sp. NPDC002773 TaxID=3154430 RepID=UPI00332DB72B
MVVVPAFLWSRELTDLPRTSPHHVGALRRRKEFMSSKESTANGRNVSSELVVGK